MRGVEVTGQPGEWAAVRVRQPRRPCPRPWGRWTPSSDSVHWVAGTFKVTGRGEQRICLRSCFKPERSPAETTGALPELAGTTRCVLRGRPRAGRATAERVPVLGDLQQVEALSVP